MRSATPRAARPQVRAGPRRRSAWGAACQRVGVVGRRRWTLAAFERAGGGARTGAELSFLSLVLPTLSRDFSPFLAQDVERNPKRGFGNTEPPLRCCSSVCMFVSLSSTPVCFSLSASFLSPTCMHVCTCVRRYVHVSGCHAHRSKLTGGCPKPQRTWNIHTPQKHAYISLPSIVTHALCIHFATHRPDILHPHSAAWGACLGALSMGR